jgi:hypothetical protein
MIGLRSVGQDAAYFEFLANPTVFLLNRRVRRIVYLRGGADKNLKRTLVMIFPTNHLTTTH